MRVLNEDSGRRRFRLRLRIAPDPQQRVGDASGDNERVFPLVARLIRRRGSSGSVSRRQRKGIVRAPLAIHAAGIVLRSGIVLAGGRRFGLDGWAGFVGLKAPRQRLVRGEIEGVSGGRVSVASAAPSTAGDSIQRTAHAIQVVLIPSNLWSDGDALPEHAQRIVMGRGIGRVYGGTLAPFDG